jgi:hypothetical protein
MKYFDEIEKYLNGEMDAAARKNFEQRLRQDPELRDAYKNHLEVYDAIKDRDLIDFREKLEKIGKAQQKKGRGKGKPRNRMLLYWISGAAAMALLALVFYLVFGLRLNHNKQFANEGDGTRDINLPESYFELKRMLTRGQGSWLPADSTIFSYGEKITFRFGVEPDSNLLVEIFKSPGARIYSEKTGSGPTISMMKPLEDGIYYYKVKRSDSLLYIGYFIVGGQ